MDTAAVIATIDRLHGEDPAGRELAYAQRMTRWLQRLNQHPDPLLAIAVRAQHLKRWECPRNEFPAGRQGYLQWRRRAAQHHADLVAGILRQAGFDEEAVTRVVSLVRKRGIGRDKDAQALEDCACLAFLEADLEDFQAKHPPSKVDDILRKTWHKMSPAAQRLAGPLAETAMGDEL